MDCVPMSQSLREQLALRLRRFIRSQGHAGYVATKAAMASSWDSELGPPRQMPVLTHRRASGCSTKLLLL